MRGSRIILCKTPVLLACPSPRCAIPVGGYDNVVAVVPVPAQTRLSLASEQGYQIACVHIINGLHTFMSTQGWACHGKDSVVLSQTTPCIARMVLVSHFSDSGGALQHVMISQDTASRAVLTTLCSAGWCKFHTTLILVVLSHYAALQDGAD